MLLSLLLGSGCGLDSLDSVAAPKDPVQSEPPQQGDPVATPPKAPKPDMIRKLLDFDEERVRLTLSYLRAHNDPDLDPEDPAGTFMEPKVVVLHWTGGSTAAGVLRTFAPSRLRGRPNLQGAGAVNVAAHFVVDRDGQITQLLETTRIGRHTIGLNHISVGIENVGYEPKYPLTDAQVQANAALVRWLHGVHGVTHVIGHHEYRQMEEHRYFVELDPKYRTSKVDPGDRFVAAVLQRVADLRLQRAPRKNRGGSSGRR